MATRDICLYQIRRRVNQQNLERINLSLVEFSRVVEFSNSVPRSITSGCRCTVRVKKTLTQRWYILNDLWTAFRISCTSLCHRTGASQFLYSGSRSTARRSRMCTGRSSSIAPKGTINKWKHCNILYVSVFISYWTFSFNPYSPVTELLNIPKSQIQEYLSC